MAFFVPEFCSDYPLGYQTVAALDGNDALILGQLRVGHNEETGEHTDMAIPTGLVRVGTAVQRSVSWAHGCLGFLPVERVGVTSPQLLASTYFSDETDPRFVFLSTETDTTGEYAYDACSLLCASRTELTLLENPMVAFWFSRPVSGVDFGIEWPPQPMLADLNSIRDGDTFARVRAVELTDGVIAKLTALAGGGSTKAVTVANDGTLAAALITPALTDGSFADAFDLDEVAKRIAVLEAQPDAFPLNGGFEIYDSGAGTFANWTGTFDGTGVDPTAGRYIELGTTARSVDSAEFPVAAGYNTLRVLARRPSGTGTSGSVRVRWYDASHAFLSQSSLSIVTAVANAWEWSVLALTAPSNAVYAVVRLTNEGSVTLQYGGVLISQPSFILGPAGSSPATEGASYDGRTLTLQPADATHAGIVKASGSQSVGAQLQLPAGSTVAVYESWINLTLNTNWSTWTTFGSNYGFARYRRDALGHVELEVQVRYVGSGTAAWSGTIANLPSGYRPQVKHRFGADSGRSSGANDLYCSVDIDNASGNLTVINSQQNSGTTYTWVCFHARFRSDT